MQNNINLLGIKISCVSEEEILENIEKYLKSGKGKAERGKFLGQKPFTIFSINPEIIMYAQKNEYFKQIVNTGQINIPDGSGVVWGSNTLGRPIRKRISGADLVEDLASLASKQNVRVGLIGGEDKIALKALECLQARNPELLGWAESGPKINFANRESRIALNYGDWDIKEFLKRVKERNTKILFVGFGYPKQERFINTIKPYLNDVVIMSVGGTFDYLSGRIPRAPKYLQALGLEWLFRLLKEPSRIKRQLAIPKFITLVLKEKFLY